MAIIINKCDFSGRLFLISKKIFSVIFSIKSFEDAIRSPKFVTQDNAGQYFIHLDN